MCPLSTGGGTRRVQLVRGEGRDGARRRWALGWSCTERSRRAQPCRAAPQVNFRAPKVDKPRRAEPLGRVGGAAGAARRPTMRGWSRLVRGEGHGVSD